MDIFLTPIVLGIVEGITEFLPISSTGHLIIANQFFQLENNFREIFDVVIQFGAILSVIVYFRSRIIPFYKGQTDDQRRGILKLWKKTVVGVIPALIAGAFLGHKIKELLFNPITVAIALILGGVILIWVEGRKKTSVINDISGLSYVDALIIGLFQCLAMIPGTSRSAATIIGSMLLGTSRKVAAEFSFFLAIPTMLAASTYSLLDAGLKLTITQWQVLAVGFVVSFLVAWAVIAIFIDYISKRDFKAFGYYRIVLGFIILTVYFKIY